MNRTVSNVTITIMGGKIAAENICSHLKQTKQILIRAISCQFKEISPEAGKTFNTERTTRFWAGDREER